jgi:BON domain-containing protein
MTRRSQLTLAALVGIGLSHPVAAQEPPRLAINADRPIAQQPAVSPNQQVADNIADHLRQSGQIQHYNIDIVFQDGTAVVSGTVLDQIHRDEAIRLIQGVPGVERVLDRLAVSPPVLQTQAATPGAQEPAPLPRKAADGATGPVEPMPIYGGGMAGPYDAAPPRMPPYAWPTYAPYNNFSRVAYPQCYPYNAWPYIGPIYPFPKIPTSWRKVSLEWQDGHWWYGMNSNSHDWWRLRFW